MNEPLLITTGEIAALMGFSAKHVNRHWREWGLKRVDCGAPRTIRFKRESVMQMLRNRGLLS